jgi:lipid II:glycine glycyltransferase (peptidoglycan interpeptide bridge formation enzyme)
VEITNRESKRGWDDVVASFREAHVLQTYEWASVKWRYGWTPLPRIWKEGEEIKAAALTLMREERIPLIHQKIRVFYVPKGPLISDWTNAKLVNQVLSDLAAMAREYHAVFVKIDPDVVYGRGEGNDLENVNGRTIFKTDALLNPGIDELGWKIVRELGRLGWQFSKEQIQFRNTVVSHLALPDEELLKRMKQKTRYNIRLAEKRGVKVREGTAEDIPLLYHLYHETATRDGFIIREQKYYEDVWGTFLKGDSPSLPPAKESDLEQLWVQGGKSCPTAKSFIAEVEGDAVAGIIVFIFGDKAWYMYGMSSGSHRERMPNYLLHWEAICALKKMGITTYDWWGAPDFFSEVDPMYGVYRFKEGFGGEVQRYIGAWDYVVSPYLYRLYQDIIPLLLRLLRAKRRVSL